MPPKGIVVLSSCIQTALRSLPNLETNLSQRSLGSYPRNQLLVASSVLPSLLPPVTFVELYRLSTQAAAVAITQVLATCYLQQVMLCIGIPLHKHVTPFMLVRHADLKAQCILHGEGKEGQIIRSQTSPDPKLFNSIILNRNSYPACRRKKVASYGQSR